MRSKLEALQEARFHLTFVVTLQKKKINHDFQIKITSSPVKPRLHEQFLCGNCMWQFLFARVDGSTNIGC